MNGKSRKTKEERAQYSKELVKSLLKQLEDGVNNFTYDPEDFKALLKMKALMPQYSFKNFLLARQQIQVATYLNSFSGWEKLGRHIKKGQKALRILKPVFEKKKELVDGKEVETQKIKFFLPVPVFDVSQTEGAELPIDHMKLKLDGDDPEADEIIQSIHNISDCPIDYGDTDPANGLYFTTLHKILVSDKLSTNHRAKTLVHEYVHSRLHRYSKATKEEMEMVAEGAAYIICSRFGLDTSDYSFQYIHSWKQNSDAFVRYGEKMMNISKEIIESIEEDQSRNLKVRVETA